MIDQQIFLEHKMKLNSKFSESIEANITLMKYQIYPFKMHFSKFYNKIYLVVMLPKSLSFNQRILCFFSYEIIVMRYYSGRFICHLRKNVNCLNCKKLMKIFFHIELYLHCRINKKIQYENACA